MSYNKGVTGWLTMFGFGKKYNREEHRYYLLPGMGRGRRRRHQQIMRWSIVVALIFGALLGGLLYWLSKP